MYVPHHTVTTAPGVLHHACDACLLSCGTDYYWELVETWKKLFLVGFAVLIRPGSVEQLVVSFLVCLTFLLLSAVARPLREDSDDVFANACNFCITSMFFCCIILKLGTQIKKTV